MAVQIPRLKQFQTSDGIPSNPRINVNIPNQANNILQTGEALRGVAKEAIGLQQDIEDDKINQLSSEAKVEYKNWSTSELARIRRVEGDPTEEYVKYDKESKVKYDEILESKQGNARVKGFVKNTLDATRNSYNPGILKQRGLQMEVYRSKLDKASLKLEKDEMSINASNIIKGDRGSFLFYDQNIADIKTIIAKKGMRNGTVSDTRKNSGDTKYTYIDGTNKKVTVYMGKIAQMNLAKELNEGVVNSINTAISSNELEIAKTMMEEYDGYLDSKGKTLLNGKLDKKYLKQEANQIAFDIEGKDKVDQDIAIRKATKKNPELGSEILGKLSSIVSKRTALNKNRENANYERLSKEILAMKKSGNLHGMSDLEDSPVYSETWGKLSATQQKSITEEFNAPKETDPKAKVKMQEALILGIDKLNPLEFQELKVGMSKPDKNKYDRIYENAKTNKSNLSQTMRINKRGFDLMKSQLFEQKLIDRDFGKLDDASNQLLGVLNDALINYLETVPSNVSDKELKDFVTNFVTKAKKTDLFGAPWFGKNLPISTVGTAVQQKRTGDPFAGIDPDKVRSIRFKLQKAFKEDFNRALPPNPKDPAFIKYVWDNIGSVK